jgi:thiosulfate/3-mercaptopyruvate sulfurtransferase
MPVPPPPALPSALLPPLVDAATLAEHLGDPRLRIFDTTVRLLRPPAGGRYTPESGRASYSARHLPSAGFADLVGDLADPDSRFPFALPSPGRFAAAAGRLGIGPGCHVVTYAQESPMWATRLWWLLRYFGFDDVSVLDGGLPAWQAAGLPVTADQRAYPPARFQPAVRPQLLAHRAQVEATIAADNHGAGADASDRPECLVNALSEAAFRGDGVSSYERPGRIPGSVNVPAAGLLDPTTNRFLAPAQLRAALDDVLDVPRLVLYCGGGISATVDAFALALLGRTDAALYDGSLAEWSADPALPLEVG